MSEYPEQFYINHWFIKSFIKFKFKFPKFGYFIFDSTVTKVN